jgi:hypothetical protein
MGEMITLDIENKIEYIRMDIDEYGQRLYEKGVYDEGFRRESLKRLQEIQKRMFDLMEEIANPVISDEAGKS